MTRTLGHLQVSRTDTGQTAMQTTGLEATCPR